MNRYRVSGTVDEAHLSAVIAAFSAAAMRSQLDPEMTLSLMSVFNALAPKPVQDGATESPTPAKVRVVKRVIKRSNGGEWPTKDSIYDVVLQAVRAEPRVPGDLRDILTASGYSAGSLNSALGRLEKANKVRRTDDGFWNAA